MNAISTQAGLATPEFVRSAEILLELQRKKAEGTDDDDQSEELRDESEPLWWKLSETQRRAISGLSADLFSFTDPPAPLEPPDPQFERAMDRMRMAVASGDWLTTLELNRRWRTRIEPAKLAVRRADAWRHLGLPKIALAFADFGTNLDRLALPTGWSRMDALAAIDQASPRQELQRAEAAGTLLSPGEVCWLAMEAVKRNVADHRELALLQGAVDELARSSSLSDAEKGRRWQVVVDLGRIVHVCMRRNADWTAWCDGLKRDSPALANLPLPPEGYFESQRAANFNAVS